MSPEHNKTTEKNSLTRRNFVRKTALISGSVSLAGLINAHGEGGGPATTTGTTTTTTVTATVTYLWWKKYSVDPGESVNIFQSDVDEQPANLTLEQKQDRASKKELAISKGTAIDQHKAAGGTELNPHTYEIVSGTYDFEDNEADDGGKATVTGTEPLIIKHTLRS